MGSIDTDRILGFGFKPGLVSHGRGVRFSERITDRRASSVDLPVKATSAKQPGLMRRYGLVVLWSVAALSTAAGGTAQMVSSKLRESMASLSSQVDNLAEPVIRQTTPILAQLEQAPAYYNRDKIISEMTASAVMVESEGSIGSGALIQDDSGRWFVLTSNMMTHQFDNSQPTYTPKRFTVTCQNNTAGGKPIAIKAELAEDAQGQPFYSHPFMYSLLEVIEPSKLPKSARSLRIRDLKATPLELGEAVMNVSATQDFTNIVNPGRVAGPLTPWSDEFDFIPMSFPANSASGGSIAFDMSGQAVGLVWGSVTDKKTPILSDIVIYDGFGKVIPLHLILAELKKRGFSYPDTMADGGGRI